MQFSTNTGVVDRVIRAVIGLAIIAGFWIWPDVTYRWAFWLGLIPLATAVVGWCPVYRLFGWSTAEHDRGPTAKA